MHWIETHINPYKIQRNNLASRNANKSSWKASLTHTFPKDYRNTPTTSIVQLIVLIGIFWMIQVY